MRHVLGLKCLVCGAEHAADEVDYVCPKHGNEGILDVQYDYGLIARELSPKSLAKNPQRDIWRYKPLLPVKPDSPAPPLQVGWTPLYLSPRLGEPLGLKHLYVKDDGRQPTASFKDRASAVAVVKAREQGASVITTASTGNAAAALAGLCASVGQQSVIFVPASAPEAKVAQLLVYGATVLLVNGTYDQAFDLCLEASAEYGWYNRNTGYNPYMSEGKKTASLEICEQLGWKAPDRVFVSVGDGCIIGGLHKGFSDLRALGWIDKMPKLMGVQAQGSAAMYHAWKDQIAPLDMQPIDAHTIADSISAGLPRDRIKAMRAVVETGGAFLAVSDMEILQAIPALARGAGVFAEPAGAAAYAGLLKAMQQHLVDPDETIVVLVTGSGLKDVRAAMKSVGQALRVEPDLNSVRRALQGLFS